MKNFNRGAICCSRRTSYYSKFGWAFFSAADEPDLSGSPTSSASCRIISKTHVVPCASKAQKCPRVRKSFSTNTLALWPTIDIDLVTSDISLPLHGEYRLPTPIPSPKADNLSALTITSLSPFPTAVVPPPHRPISTSYPLLRHHSQILLHPRCLRPKMHNPITPFVNGNKILASRQSGAKKELQISILSPAKGHEIIRVDLETYICSASLPLCHFQLLK